MPLPMTDASWDKIVIIGAILPGSHDSVLRPANGLCWPWYKSCDGLDLHMTVCLPHAGTTIQKHFQAALLAILFGSIHCLITGAPKLRDATPWRAASNLKGRHGKVANSEGQYPLLWPENASQSHLIQAG